MITHVNNNLRFNTCPLCNSLEIAKINNFSYTKPTYFSSNEIVLSKQPELWKCSYCESSFVQNIIPEEMSKSLYCQGSSDQRWKSEPFSHSKSIHLTNTLQSFFQKDLKILDIGCNTGELLDFAKLQGCETFGIEYSESSHKALKQKGHIIFSDIDNTNERFNIITAFDLIEHIYNVPDFLNTCFKQLLPSGYLILFTGNIMCLTAKLLKGKWWYIGWPEHIVFPSIKYFEIQNNFKVIQVIKTYHSNYFKPNLNLFFKTFLKKGYKNYNGVPAMQADHIMIILKKEN
jgi:SAM-dependent methyltransferase